LDQAALAPGKRVRFLAPQLFRLVSPVLFRLVVGLGNPGKEYVETRHNVGFLVVEQIAAKEKASWKKERRWQVDWAKAGSVLLCKPLTYMNLSGQAVRAMADFYKIEPAEILVISDDFALPLGKLRFRPGGSAGGHNGLKSVIEHLGTLEFPRLRIGIGAAEGGVVDHVLGRFALEEREPLAECLARAVDAIDFAQSRGLAAAMNQYN
jgi:PTH1 family peptidyl-tRNA hydrolase